MLCYYILFAFETKLMYNITLLSLSLSSVYSFSPLLVGNQNSFQHLSFYNYFFSTIIFNPQRLTLEKSRFYNGIGSLIVSNCVKIQNEDAYPEFIENSFNNDDFIVLTPPNEKSLVIVRDCIFSLIQYTSSANEKYSKNLICIGSMITFYMTSCTFDSCKFNSPILNLNSWATTISHIGCSQLSTTQNSNSIFLQSNTPGSSFFKFFYSTLYGDNTDFGGVASLWYQCTNISFFKLKGNDRSITRFGQLSCISSLMNSYYSCNSYSITFFNLGDGKDTDRYNHYCGLTNFINNIHDKSIITLDLQSKTKITIDKCVFSNQDKYKKKLLTITVLLNWLFQIVYLKQICFFNDLTILSSFF